MSASTIIEKYHHQLTKPKLLFLVWFCDKYPDGVVRSKINYPHCNNRRLDGVILPELEQIGAVRIENKHSYNSIVKPC